ncbi:MAG: thioredoxin domain-containing protein, partial [Polyangiaceae bacterium]|nr:thioredoxin domain-containing protein [Polyangiaceae bacterium]
FEATRTTDGSVCTVRIALHVEVAEHQQASLQSAFSRIARHGVGIPHLAPLRAAGAIDLHGRPRLAVAHGGQVGTCAQQRIAEGIPANLSEVLAALQSVTEAIGALHDQGVVHGAVHPAAIRLDTQSATLSAFGLSELAAVVQGPAGARDVLPARSRTPEQVGLVPASPSPESDTYALTMVALELLAGRPFTPLQDPDEIARRIDHPIARPTPRALGLQVPDRVEELFARALRIDPRSREHEPRALWAAMTAARAPQLGDDPEQTSNEPPAPSTPHAPATISGAGFDPPPRPRAERPQPSHWQTPTGVAPAPAASAGSGAVLVYLLIGGGLLLLLAGAGAAFYITMLGRPAPAPVATATTALPPSTPAPTPVPLAPAASGDTAPERDAAAPELPLAQLTDSGIPTTHPDDAKALIPLHPDMPIVGHRNALVTVVLFADMQCPYTRRARAALERLLNQYRGELRVAVLHLPMSEHAGAEHAAELAAATGAIAGPTAFWNLFESLTENQSVQDEKQLLRWAERAGADTSKLVTALNAKTYHPIVARDRQLAGQLMVRGTPTFFINGRRLNGMQPQSVLSDEIERERSAASASRTSGTAPSDLYASRVRFNITSAAADRRVPRTP